ncbi:MAG: adenylate/guanylate cyclase domain-containing protein [Kiloniellales bacterium]
MDRRLTAILAADVVGYSRLMGAQEEATLRRLDELQKIVQSRVAGAAGRVFSLAGDGLLAEFASPVAAVRTAFDIQRDLGQLNRGGSEPLELRIGVHLADVVVKGDDLLGDGVNIAARIEGAAAPGTVTISQAIFDQVKRTANLIFEDLGEHDLKNISEPLRLYRVAGEQPIHSYGSSPQDGTPISEGPPAPTDKPSIAVLPFVNMSGDREQDYFTDGFSEDLITELARFKALFVVSRNASFAYRGRDVDLRQVGRDLGVAHCLEGSVRKIGSRVRITAQLIDAVSGEHLWADRFDCKLEELFDVQDELASHIVATIADLVEANAGAAARRKRPADLDAYDCLLHGLEYHRLGGVTREHADKAVEWFDRAIEKDSDYGRAHAWRACAIATQGDWADNIDWFDDCIASAQRGLELDANEGEVHRIMGSINLFQRKFDKAAYHFQRGIELNPNHAYIIAKTAELHNYLGDGEKSLELLARAQRLDPFLPDYCREETAVAYYILERYAEALAANAELARLSRRAAVYGVASTTHCDDRDTGAAVQELLRIDPGFQIAAFVRDEPFKDRGYRERLIADLATADLPTSSRT